MKLDFLKAVIDVINPWKKIDQPAVLAEINEKLGELNALLKYINSPSQMTAVYNSERFDIFHEKAGVRGNEPIVSALIDTEKNKAIIIISDAYKKEIYERNDRTQHGPYMSDVPHYLIATEACKMTFFALQEDELERLRSIVFAGQTIKSLQALEAK